MDTIRFGTGGWRAVIGEDFTCGNVRRVAAASLAYLSERGLTDKPVIVGYDRRFLSEDAAKWVAEVFAAGGIRVLFLPRSAPTPLIMHTVKDRELHLGIEITASHNPSHYNGVKLIVEEGRDAPVEVTEEIERKTDVLEKVAFTDFDEAVKDGRISYIKNPFNRFLDDIIALLDMNALRERGLRVLFDSMHGSGTYPLTVIFHTARCTIDTIHINKDAYFGGVMPAPSENSLVPLRDAVIKGGYDLGIAMDGDGDRLGIIDPSGRYVTPNEILCMLYQYLVKYKGWRGPAVRNLATTHLLDKIAASFGERCYEVPVGFKYISAKIDEVDAVLGGESSGGLTVRGHIHGKDSIYAASLFAEMISVMGKTPGEILREMENRYGRFVAVEDNLRFSPERKSAIANVLTVEKRLPDFAEKVERVNYVDGCKVYFENGGWVICRFSGTEPLLRIFAESDARASALGYIAAFKSFLGL